MSQPQTLLSQHDTPRKHKKNLTLYVVTGIIVFILMILIGLITFHNPSNNNNLSNKSNSSNCDGVYVIKYNLHILKT